MDATHEESSTGSDLLQPLLNELVGLLALDPEGRGGEDEIALVHASGPLYRIVDDRRVDARDLLEDVRQVCAVDVDRVCLGVAGRESVADGVELEVGGELHQLINCGCHAEEAVLEEGMGLGADVVTAESRCREITCKRSRRRSRGGRDRGGVLILESL